MASENTYEAFNKFQTAFFTNINDFSRYSNYEIKQYAVMLLNTITKGTPALAEFVGQIYSPDVKAIQSPEFFIALQRRFVNGFTQPRIPQFVYYKGSTKKSKKETATVSKKDKKLLDFSEEIVAEICSIMFIDSKTYQLIRYSLDVQKLGRHIQGQIAERETAAMEKARLRALKKQQKSF